MRTGIEVTVLVLGWLLGGSVGIGTVVFAVTIGPLVAFFLPEPAPHRLEADDRGPISTLDGVLTRSRSGHGWSRTPSSVT